MNNPVRLRLAPSPTGEPHVGNIRTAIFNWLYARHHKGALVIRVEDTDQGRKVQGSTEQMLDALNWLGIDWDEGPDVGGTFGPYFQSQRLELYNSIADQLLDSGRAYYCYCSSERLTLLRQKQIAKKENPGYDGRCRYIAKRDVGRDKLSDVKPVIRFRMLEEGNTVVDDVIRGRVVTENNLFDDYIMIKSDGFPTYHMASVVDDHYMQISHVMRGEEWLPSTPRHVQLYQALGWTPPKFVHLPIILARDKSKLSKRHGVTSILEYKAKGYVPQAMVNFLTLLGWSLDGSTELFSVNELVDNFSLDRISKSGAIFDAEKLNWMNGHYIRSMDEEELGRLLLRYWDEFPITDIPKVEPSTLITDISSLIQERLKILSDAAPLIKFFFCDEVKYEASELIQKGMDIDGTKLILSSCLSALEEVLEFTSDPIEASLRALSAELDVKLGQLLGTLRVATTGLKVSPPLFQSMEISGKKRIIKDIQLAMNRLSVKN